MRFAAMAAQFEGEIAAQLAEINSKTPTLRDQIAIAIISSGGNIYEAYERADIVLKTREANNDIF
jgi:hypothetical protein